MRVHRNRHDRAFTVIPNCAARDKRLSLAARGLHVTLLSLPDGTKVTVESMTDRVEEGRRAVAKAFQQLEDAGYLRRDRFQNPESGLWCTETRISDLPTDRFPKVGEPEARSVGHSPKGERNQGKNLLLPSEAEVEGDGGKAVEEEGDASGDENNQPPADAAVGKAARVLAKLGVEDGRLALSTAEVLRLAPLAAGWLAQGHSPAKVTGVLSARLPEQLDSAFGLISYRLKHQMPAPPKAKAAPQPDTRHRCEVCDAPFPAGRPGGTCATCRQELDRAATFLAGGEPLTPGADDRHALSRWGRDLCRSTAVAA
ncbi:hypothetical protein ACH5AU_30770 [Streptomyces albidoflavus]